MTDLAIGEASAIELWGEHAGQPWHLERRVPRRVVKRRAGGEGSEVSHEAYLSVGGAEVDTLGRVNDFAAEVARRFMPPTLYLASIYAAQHGKGSFVGLAEAARRDLFADLLGIGDLQDKAEAAVKVSKAAAEAIGEIDRRLVEARARAARRAELAGDVEARREQAAAAAQVAKAAQDEAASLLRRLDDFRAALTRIRRSLAEADREREEADARALANRRERADLVVRVADLAGIVEGAADLRRRVAEGEAVEARVAAAEAAALGAAQALDGARGRLEAAETRIRGLREREGRLVLAVAVRRELRELDDEAAVVEADGKAARAAEDLAREALTAAQADERKAREALEAHDREIAVQRRQVADLLASCRKGAALLERVPCGGRVIEIPPSGAPDDGGDRIDCASCELLATARRADAQIGELEEREFVLRADEGRDVLAEAVVLARAKVGEAQGTLDAAALVTQGHRDTLTGLRGRRGPLAAQVPADLDEQIRRGAEQIAEEEAIRDEVADTVKRHETAAKGARLEADRVAAESRIPSDLAELREQVKRIEEAEADLPRARERLASLDGLHEGLVAAMDRATAQAGRLRQELADLADEDPETSTPNDPDRVVQDFEWAHRQATARAAKAQLEADTARDAAASIQGALAETEGAEARVIKLEAARDELAGIHARHELLGASLGRKGVQAHEIDGAGPLVSGLVNDLLGACYGPRFRVELVTQQEADGKRKEREVFDLRIWDGERGDRRSFDALSGGEQVIIDEALKLALALLTTRRSGIRCGVLYRDEVDGKLDHDNAHRYPAMLRRAMEIGGFRRVYFVSHRPEVYGQADGRIELGGPRPVLEG